MKINFVEISFKNFLSYGNVFTTLKLDTHKTTLISGVNGSGKSTVLDAISFALFNKPFRPDINKPDLMNEITNKDCVVDVSFDVGTARYIVKRGIKPNIFEIYKNGELINPKSDSTDYQVFLERQIIRCNHRSFLQTVVLGAANYTPFMKLTVPQRREVIESLLDLKVFSTMQGTLKTRIAEITSELSMAQRNADLIEKKIELVIESNKALQASNDSVIAQKEKVKADLLEKSKECQKAIDGYETDLESLPYSHPDMERVALAIKKHTALLSDLKAKESALRHDIEFLQDHTDCPTCRQPINQEFRGLTVKEKMAKIEAIAEAISKVSETINDHNLEKLALESMKEKIREVKAVIDRESFKENQFANQIASLDSEIEILRTPAKSVLGDTAALEEERRGFQKAYNLLEDEKIQHAHALTITPSIKTAVIKKYIPKFNERIDFYLQQFESLIRFHLNEHFEETIINRGRDKLGYGSFSEGEKFRVNLALLFAWRDVARSRGSIDSNLLFLDEIMDSSLDAEGMECSMGIIKRLNDGTHIYVISHRDGDIMDTFDRTIRATKTSHFSSLNVQ